MRKNIQKKLIAVQKWTSIIYTESIRKLENKGKVYTPVLIQDMRTVVHL